MILVYLLGFGLALFIAKVGIRPSKKRIVRQRGVPNVIPFANDGKRLAQRARRGNA